VIEFAGFYINPFEVATIKVRPFLNQGVMNVSVGMSSGQVLEQQMPPDAAEDFVDAIATIVGGDIEELLNGDDPEDV